MFHIDSGKGRSKLSCRLEARLQAAEDKRAALEASSGRRINQLSAQLAAVQPVPGTFEAALSAVQQLADELDVRSRSLESQQSG